MERPPSSFRPAGAATPAIEATLGAASALVLGVGSALRRSRIFHPDGVAFTATVDVDDATVLPAGRHPALVRFSRGAGLPEPLPDVLGLALRVEDVHGPGRHQDLLFVTSWSAPGLRHALVPGLTFGHQRWSTVLTYEVPGGRRVVFGARPATTALDGAARLADLGRLGTGAAFVLEVAPPTAGWDRIGALTIGDPLPSSAAEGLRFNPANTGGGVAPVGVLQAVRRQAYRGSQRGRPARR